MKITAEIHQRASRLPLREKAIYFQLLGKEKLTAKEKRKLQNLQSKIK